MMGKQRAAGDAEIAPARFATEAQRTRRAAALIDCGTFAMRADGLASGPAQISESCLGFRVGHAQDRR